MPDIFVALAKEERVASEKQEQAVHKIVDKDTHPEHKPISPLTAYADHPNGIFFATQREGEGCELFLRQHFITNIPWIGFSILLFLLPAFGFLFFSFFFPFSLSTQMTVVLTSFWYLATFGLIILTSFINWYFNVYIVTSERIIDVDFVNILYREISSTRLNLVQDVTVKTGGVIQAIFHFGNVFIQTAGTEENFNFLSVPNPDAVADRIEELMKESRLTEGKSDFEEAILK